MTRLRSLASLLLVTALGCGGNTTATMSPPADTSGTFSVVGNAEAPSGATWTFRGTVGGVTYDLSGVLLKPAGAGPFPAVVLSHGAGGNAASFASVLGPTMVQWGLVVIATSYTHSGGVPIGAPGDATQPGASQANVSRAHMTRELLRRLGYVDMSRVALHGHSMGAFLGVAVAGAYPTDARVASHTAGGVRPDAIISGPAPSSTQARGIRIPFQVHHGDVDATVSVSYDVRFDSLLTTMGVDHQLYVYPGADHNDVRLDATVLARVRAWYAAHGMF
jgi:dienelactone hydrolase